MRKAVISMALIGLFVMFAAPVNGADIPNRSKYLRSTADQLSLDNSTIADQPVNKDGNLVDYTGTLRVFISEPTSRWTDNNGMKYDYGFLDFAMVSSLSIPYLGTYEETQTWTAVGSQFNSITQDNVVAQAVVYNSVGVRNYSDPPSGYPFDAYYVDAAAQASPGVPGSNIVDGSSTHTVFIEEGTATW